MTIENELELRFDMLMAVNGNCIRRLESLSRNEPSIMRHQYSHHRNELASETNSRLNAIGFQSVSTAWPYKVAQFQDLIPL